MAACFDLPGHHQEIYTVITKIIDLYNGSVVSRSTFYFIAMLCSLFSHSLIKEVIKFSILHSKTLS
jgi:hypothetical protein